MMGETKMIKTTVQKQAVKKRDAALDRMLKNLKKSHQWFLGFFFIFFVLVITVVGFTFFSVLD
ncbi:MAG: hypothetical protein GY950_36580 [bacterium]|nr:hypothetical protein [bacterium]